MKPVISILLAPLTALAAPTQLLPRQASDSLSALYEGVGKIYFGNIAEKGRLETGKNAAVIQADFGQVTPEWSMKWAATEPTQNQFTWDDADYLVDWAEENGKSIRGHTLLWHIELPDWVSGITDRDTLTEAIENHVTTLVARYKGRIRAWVSAVVVGDRLQSLTRTLGCRQRDLQ
jgi:endo-1,4-beta-xylanase